MNLVLFTHPDFLGSQSQPRFARMLLEAYRERGHRAELRQPQPWLRAHLTKGGLAKWAGYVDQYMVFPLALRRRAAADPPDTLYVFCDQALGPWVPRVAHRPHVVHCHDLLALRSALGLVPENPTAATGRIYQRYIRAGFRRARHFISISNRSRDDLHRYGRVTAVTSEVVYNGLNHAYRPLSEDEATAALRQAGVHALQSAFLLHVGGGQWYKNSVGVLALYAALARSLQATGRAVPALWLVSPEPGAALRQQIAALPPACQVRFLSAVPAPALQALYSTALALLFPSLAEGFGWPIAEGLACGCPVVTTGEAPMIEVGGEHAHYLPRRRADEPLDDWAERGAALLMRLLDRPAAERQSAAEAGRRWAERFDAARAIDRYLEIYEQVLAHECEARPGSVQARAER